MLALIRNASKRPLVVSAIFAGGIGLAAWFAPQLKISAQLLELLPEHHPSVEEYRKFQLSLIHI